MLYEWQTGQNLIKILLLEQSDLVHVYVCSDMSVKIFSMNTVYEIHSSVGKSGNSR